LGLADEFVAQPVSATGLAALRAAAAPLPPAAGTATTLVVLATDVTLDKAGCARLAAMGHDGLARALSPVHTAMDGDTVFGLSTAARPVPELAELVALQAAAADVVSRAVAHAVLAAHTVRTPARVLSSYRDLTQQG
jgi:L-aminopeptidase/D-esterase-like protein